MSTLSADSSPHIGIIGGSGFYALADDLRAAPHETPYGPPSSDLRTGTFSGRRVAFLSRHGDGHIYPAHKVPYLANFRVLALEGVSTLVSTFTCGSLQPHIAPGDFVVCDQIIDRTWGRRQTFYDGPGSFHATFADPYCPQLRAVATEAAEDEGITVHGSGTVVVIQGPRFSTKAESREFTRAGGSVINMTQMPEAALARELGMCFVGIALVTDYDAGVSAPGSGPESEPVTFEMVLETFNQNIGNVKKLLVRLVGNLPANAAGCCAHHSGPSVKNPA